MTERKLEDMCVVCNDHGKPSCGYEERGIQAKCPYNDLIERGYELAEKDLALTWEDIAAIDGIIIDSNNEMAVNYSQEISRQRFYEDVLKRFNEYKEKIK